MIVNWPKAAEWLAKPIGNPPNDLFRFVMSKCKVKPVKPKIRLPRGLKVKSIKALKKKAWDVFSKFIRQRDTGVFGDCECCTCGKLKHWKEMQAGHFVSRIYESTLFDEMNVFSQCAGCNMPPNNGKPIEFARFLDTRFGAGTSESIRAKAHRRRMDRNELEIIIKKYEVKGEL